MNTSRKTIIAVAIAAMMFLPMVFVSEDSSASAQTAGQFNVYVGFDDLNWGDPYECVGYNAYVAISGSAIGTDFGTIVADDDYTKIEYGYRTINPNYGTISAIGSDSNGTSSWRVYCYSEDTEKWEPGVEALGFYKAFSDYDINMRTANIALYYGDSELTADQLLTIPTNQLKDPVSVLNNPAFKMTFNVSISPMYGVNPPAGVSDSAWAELTANVGPHEGYGSDAYLALKNAIPSVVGNGNIWSEQYGINSGVYGSFTEMYGVQQTSDVTQSTNPNGDVINHGKYDNYAIYVGSSLGSASFSGFLLGFFTPAGVVLDNTTGVVCSGNQFCIQYEHTEFDWPA